MFITILLLAFTELVGYTNRQLQFSISIYWLNC